MKKNMLLIIDDLVSDSPFFLPELPHTTEYFDIDLISKSPFSRDGEVLSIDGESFSVSARNFKPTSKYKTILKLWQPLFHREFWAELTRILKDKKYLIGRIKCLTLFFIRAIALKNWILANYDVRKYSILYSYWYYDSALALIMLKKQFPHLKIITRAHGYDIHRERSPVFYQPLKKYMDKHLDLIVFVSKRGMEYYKEHFAASKDDKYALYHLGVPQKMREDEICYEKKKNAEIVSCSSIIPLKRVELIIEALSLIEETQINWTHIGDGRDAEKVRALASEKLGGKRNIEYNFTGFMDNNKVIDYSRKKNPVFFIGVPTMEGGVPVSMTESASLAIPIIGTDVGGVPEIIGSDNGILLNANPTPEEIKNAILVMSSKSKEEMLAMKKSSYRKWQDKFDSTRNFERFAEKLRCNAAQAGMTKKRGQTLSH